MFSTTPNTFSPVFRQKLSSFRTSAIATSCKVRASAGASEGVGDKSETKRERVRAVT